jgi:hypothetical protein
MPEAADGASHDCASLIPLPVVRLNRLTILFGVILAYALHAPLITTALFVVVALAAGFGRRASLIFQIGTRVLRPRPNGPDGEDPRLMRFNNALAATLLGAAQLAFLLRVPLAGWILSGLVALAAAVALAGFCLGCFLFYQFKLNRARLFGS